MVNRRMRPGQVLTLIRRLSRRHGLTVVELDGRGKGSHRMCQLSDSDGCEVERFGLTGHARDLSWTALTRIEERLAPLFGDKWTEKKR